MYIFQSETPLTFNTNQKWECNLTSAHNLTWGIDGSLQSNPCCATFFGSNYYPYFREYTGAITGIGEFSDIQSTWGNFPDLKIHGDSFSNICNAPAVSPAFVSAQIKVEQSSEVIQSFTLPSGDWRDISAN